MGLNPAFQQQPGRTLPLSFGYVLLSGDIPLQTVTIAGVPYVLAILGEGEMDGKEIPVMYLPPVADTRSGLGTGNGTTSLCRGLLTSMGLFAQLTSGARFHPGRFGVKGPGIGFWSVGRGDQAGDVWFANFPSVTPLQNFSGMAYEITLGPGPITIESGSGDDTLSFSPTPAPIGVYRGARCRIFDEDGNVTDYRFTTNPAWHFVEVILRYKVKPQQPPLAGLTDAEKACFDWPAIVAFAERNAYTLSNGQPRFAGNYIFASDATMTDMLETILRCSRAYQVSTGGKIAPVGDDERDSGFLFSGEHLVPNSLSLDKKNVDKAANVFIPKFRDVNVPAVAALVSIEDFSDMGLDSSSPFIPRYQVTVKMVTDGINPFTIGTVLVLGGSLDGDGNPSWDSDYVVGFPLGDGGITDIGVSEDGVTILAPGPGGATGGATGGYLGAENARFAQRAPTNVRHRAHQRATGGPDAPGLSPRLNVKPVEYDMGNMSFDQAIRLMSYEMVRDLGPDVDAWQAPFTGSITGFLESIDANGNALVDQVCGSIITLDEWVTPELTGDYEVQERTIKGPWGKSPGTIELKLQTKTDSSAYTDIVVEPDATFFTVPNAGLNMADRIPSSRPNFAMQCTPYWDGAGNITADDTAVWWAGDVAPTIYPFAVGSLEPNTVYALYMTDPDGGGSPTYYATEGTDFSVIPDGDEYIPLCVYNTGATGIPGGGSGGSGGGAAPDLSVTEGGFGDTSAAVSWSLGGGPYTSLAFEVQRTTGFGSPDDGGWTDVYTGSLLSFEDDFLVDDTWYWYRVRATYFPSITTDWSDPVSYVTGG